MNQANNSIFPRFFTKPVQHTSESEREGRPVFKNVEYVELRVAGDSKNIPISRVNAEIIQRFGEHYEAWKRNESMPLDGVPIKEWNGISKTRAAELHAMGIQTVEALSELPDSRIQRLGMNARSLIESAKDYLTGNNIKDRLITELTDRLEAAEGEADTSVSDENEILSHTVKEYASVITKQEAIIADQVDELTSLRSNLLIQEEMIQTLKTAIYHTAKVKIPPNSTADVKSMYALSKRIKAEFKEFTPID